MFADIRDSRDMYLDPPAPILELWACQEAKGMVQYGTYEKDENKWFRIISLVQKLKAILWILPKKNYGRVTINNTTLAIISTDCLYN